MSNPIRLLPGLVLALAIVAAMFVSRAAAAPATIEPPIVEPPIVEPIVVGEDFDSAGLQGHMAYLRDPDGVLTIETVTGTDSQSRFAALPGALGLGYISDAVWIRFSVRNTTREYRNLFLDLRQVSLDEVQIFAPDLDARAATQGYRRIILGDHVPIGEREAVGASLIGSVEAPVGDSVFYIRVKTTSAMGLRGSLRAPSAMITSATVQALRFGIFAGIFALMSIANFFYWFTLREPLYRSYGLALAMQLALLIGNNGFFPPELLPGGGVGVDLALSSLSCLNHALGAWFVSDLIQARRNFPLFQKIFVAFAIYDSIATVSVFFGYYHQVIGLVYVTGALMFVMGFVGSLRLAARGVPGARSAAMALAVILIGAATTSGRLMGIVPYTVWTDYGFEVGTLVFILYMQIALAQRTRRSEAARRQAQQRTLDVSRNAERQASRLVEQRTAELEVAKDRAEEALRAEREIQAEQIRFVDVISHQYRTPLSVVSNSVASIAMSLPADDKPNHDRIERIRRAIERLVELIDVNLHRSRLEGVSANPVFRETDLATFLNEVVARASDMCGERHVVLRINSALAGRVVRVDRDMIGLAILNLVENAHKFSPARLAVEISAEPEGEGIAIRVSDRGIGIPENERVKLTQKYFRASNSANTSGMGLGLNMTAAIVKRHHGELRFESPGEGGTRVSLILPAGALPADQPFASSFATSMAK